jgi:hypothetical protein
VPHPLPALDAIDPVCRERLIDSDCFNIVFRPFVLAASENDDEETATIWFALA